MILIKVSDSSVSLLVFPHRNCRKPAVAGSDFFRIWQ